MNIKCGLFVSLWIMTLLLFTGRITQVSNSMQEYPVRHILRNANIIFKLFIHLRVARLKTVRKCDLQLVCLMLNNLNVKCVLVYQTAIQNRNSGKQTLYNSLMILLHCTHQSQFWEVQEEDLITTDDRTHHAYDLGRWSWENVTFVAEQQ